MTRRTRIVLLVCSALLALLSSWWLWPRGDHPATPLGVPPVATGPRRPATPAVPTTDRQPPAARPELRLEPATVSDEPDAEHGVFAGRVIDWGNGEPIEGAELVFAHGGAGQSVQSGADGRFELRPGQLGTYRLQVASAEGYLPYAPAWGASPIELTARARLRVDGIIVYLTPALDYTARVVDARGAPVAGATVRVLTTGEQALLPLEETYESDRKGELVFHAPDYATLEATHPDHPEPGRAVLDGNAQISHRLEIVMGASAGPAHAPPPASDADATAAIIGRVTAGGKPVPAFTVVALHQRGLASETRGFGSYFDADGRFRLALPEGEYVVRAMAFGFTTSDGVAARAVPDPTTAITLELSRGGILTGTVVSAGAGTPLELAKVSVEGAIGDGSSAVPLRQTALTNARGEFELGGLPAGMASVIAGASHHDPRIVSGLQVADGARLGPIIIELTPTPEGEKPKLELAGIGAALAPADDGMRIEQLIDGGGALEAGLVVGEIILAVDGKAVLELGFGDTIQRIRGVEGTQVSLTVRRSGGAVADVVVTRRKIRA
jgi:hypothetical protein